VPNTAGGFPWPTLLFCEYDHFTRLVEWTEEEKIRLGYSMRERKAPWFTDTELGFVLIIPCLLQSTSFCVFDGAVCRHLSAFELWQEYEIAFIDPGALHQKL
jgi:hypothetical protein